VRPHLSGQRQGSAMVRTAFTPSSTSAWETVLTSCRMVNRGEFTMPTTFAASAASVAIERATSAMSKFSR